MKNVPAYIVTDESITVVVAGKPYTISKSNASFNEVKNRIATQNFDGIEQLFNPAAAVNSFTKGNVVVQNGQVLFKGQAVHNYVVDKVLAFMRDGLPYQPLLNFLENLLQNPSFRAVSELYRFLEKSNLPITEDGHFLAYRKVREDYKDFYTGTIDNSVGQSPKMARNLVDEDKARTCSAGLHFCAYSYLSQYHGGQGRTMVVKINPANVVAIPEDYNDAKGRCCEYLVISEIQNEVEQNFGALYRENPETAFNDGADEEYDDEGSASRDAGYTAGVEDAESGLVRNADEALQDVQDGTINDSCFIAGYNEGYDAFYAEAKQVSAPKAKTAKRTISEATRNKLRKAAKRQKRDADGRYI
jgi:hypothetical protein